MPAFPSAVFDNEVQYEVRDDGVAVITLNAPQRLNAIGRMMANGVQHALDLASEDITVRAIVLTASGTRAFCVGGNLASDDDGAATGFKGRPGDAVPPTTAAAVRTLRTGMCSSLSLREMNVPTLALTLALTLTLTLALTLALTLTLTLTLTRCRPSPRSTAPAQALTHRTLTLTLTPTLSLTAHRSPLTAHRSPLTAHRSPLTSHLSPSPSP